MVNLMLMITAELDNLTNLQPQGGCDDPNFTYYIKLKCLNCKEVSPKETCMMLSESLSNSSGKGTTNLVQKCKFCSREGSVTMIPGRGRPLMLETTETRDYAPLMTFDCRGLEPVDFSFGEGWKAESSSGTKFDDIDLSGGEYADYCEKGQALVMVSNLQAKFVSVK